MSGNDIDRENQASSPIQITDRDELYKAKVLAPDSKGIERLAVQFDNELSTTITVESLKILQTYDQNITLSDVTYYTIYSSLTPKAISGFQLKFNDKKVWVRLEIDGVEVFDINVEKFKDISNLNTHDTTGMYIAWNDGTKVFYFVPALPIRAVTSLKIQARSKTGESKKFVASIIQVG